MTAASRTSFSKRAALVLGLGLGALGLAVACGAPPPPASCSPPAVCPVTGGAGAMVGGNSGGPTGGDAVGTGGAPDLGVNGQGASNSREDVRQTCDTSRVGPRLLRRLTRNELSRALHDVFPEASPTWSDVRLALDPVSNVGFTTDSRVLVATAPTVSDLLKTGEELATALTDSSLLPQVLPCATAADRACAQTFVEKYGRRLFRRPLTPDETEHYLSFFDGVSQESSFALGLKWTLVTLIQSPSAFYRSELGTESADGYALDQHELATNLAFTFTGSTPDETLLAKAEAGALGDPVALKAEASRLLATLAGAETLLNFYREWLEYAKVLGQSRDAEPEFAGTISPLLIQETEAFLSEIIEKRAGDVSTLLTADFTFLNGRLSSYYGMGGLGASAPFTEVKRTPGHGIGILGQGSLLASTSHQKYTSPTHRGLLVFKSLLCNSRPTPPDNVPLLADTAPVDDNTLTTRAKYEEYHAQGVCFECHQNFEPFGYTLEKFDETGRYREQERGLTINTAATVLLPDGSTASLTSAEDLAGLVETSDFIENCVTGLITSYYLSSGGGEVCLAEDSRRAVAQKQMSLRDFVLSLSETPHFSRRK
jgi:hypothetical protein